jgi:squalene synthase HpnC
MTKDEARTTKGTLALWLVSCLADWHRLMIMENLYDGYLGMSAVGFATELATYGPRSCEAQRAPSLAEARGYCERLAKTHYENFTVGSWLLPKRLRPHFHAIYAYCRWADDLADETGVGHSAIDLLDWWEEQLEACYRGEARHPVFVALRPTVEEFEIPVEPFRDLLAAFRQDQYRKRYETFNELLGYCRNSANPVGRLVLYVGRCATAENVTLSDSICTGLQLANFWQDVARDWRIGRAYLPQESCQAAGYTAEMFERCEYNAAFRRLLAGEVERAEGYLRAGEPLVPRFRTELAIDVALFIRGGLAILDAIRKLDYNVWRRRPEVSRLAKLKLLAKAWVETRRIGKRGDTA